MHVNLSDYLTGTAARLPAKVAVVFGNEAVTYADIERQSNALARALMRRGVTRGDRVAIFGGNSVQVIVAFWGAIKANAVAVVINPLTKVDKLRYILNDAEPSALVTDAELATTFTLAAAEARALRTCVVYGLPRDELPPLPGLTRLEDAVREEGTDRIETRCLDVDLAAIVYTSGSTGEPKGVMLTHRNMMSAATSVCAYLRMAEDEVVLNVLPLAFDYGLYQMIMMSRVGGTLILERSFAFPAQVLASAAANRVTAIPGVPTMFATMCEMGADVRRYDLQTVRLVTSTAAAVHKRHIAMLKDVFPQARIYSMYGLTECKRCTYLPPEDLARKPDSVGIAIPNTEIWIVDEHDRKLGPGEVGQLVVRGATVMRGYWRKPQATAEKLRPGPLPGEWVLYTGDYCRMDEDGYLYFIARMDDTIKSRGEKVPPKEVEDVLLSVPGVKEAAVVGVPDDILGEAVKAFVVPMRGIQLDERALRRICFSRLESYMVPKYIIVVPALLKGHNGKVDKKALQGESQRGWVSTSG